MEFRPSTVGVAGAGTMGIGIAQVCAMNGHEVILFDSFEKSLSSSLSRIEINLSKGVKRDIYDQEFADDTLSRISTTSNLEELLADIIFDAIPEDLTLKRELFLTLERINKDKTVLATNTSSIPVSQIAEVLSRPAQFIGIHFFNPAHIMKLVEVISGVKTDPDLALQVKNWISELKKIPVMANDKPGFIVNRVARSFYTENLKAAEEGTASFESIDRLMESTGFRMGPFKLMDLIGIDTNHSVTNSIFNQFNKEIRFEPSKLQDQYVREGLHGKKTRKGFYSYEE